MKYVLILQSSVIAPVNGFRRDRVLLEEIFDVSEEATVYTLMVFLVLLQTVYYYKPFCTGRTLRNFWKT